MIRSIGALALLMVANMTAPVAVQAARYSAAGTHQCPNGRCVVTGAYFSNCIEATSTLRERDCCPTTPSGGKSRGFTMNYCIAESR
jgi:hypothetical protein